MDNGIYITAARQMALFRDMEVTATNIANMDTTGFQSEHMAFKSYMVRDGIGSDMSFAHDDHTFRNTAQGAMKVTDNPLDLAISGKGYFVVQTPMGDRYTRAGSFMVNDNGTLVTTDGYAVLDANNQPIIFEPTANNITVGSTGIIQVDGETLTNIAVVEFENEQLMQRHGSRFFSSDADPILAIDSEVLQGTLEVSNVAGVSELTHMIKLSRATANTSKYIEVMYDLQRRNTTTWTQQR